MGWKLLEPSVIEGLGLYGCFSTNISYAVIAYIRTL